MRRNTLTFLLLLLILLFTSCGREKSSLSVFANGEDFVSNGFVGKEGWQIEFQNLYVNINDIEAYNPFDKDLHVISEGDFFVDLRYEPLVSVTNFKQIPIGNYQSLRFSLSPQISGEYEGYSIIMIGTASRQETLIPFTIKLHEAITFDGKEGYVGDTIKGLVEKNQTGEAEMTFHFDHIFGDASAAPSAHVNADSPGFSLFLHYAHNGSINVTQNDLKTHENYPKLIKAIETLGHLGEGHCEVIR